MPKQNKGPIGGGEGDPISLNFPGFEPTVVEIVQLGVGFVLGFSLYNIWKQNKEIIKITKDTNKIVKELYE